MKCSVKLEINIQDLFHKNMSEPVPWKDWKNSAEKGWSEDCRDRFEFLTIYC